MPKQAQNIHVKHGSSLKSACYFVMFSMEPLLPVIYTKLFLGHLMCAIHIPVSRMMTLYCLMCAINGTISSTAQTENIMHATWAE